MSDPQFRLDKDYVEPIREALRHGGYLAHKYVPAQPIGDIPTMRHVRKGCLACDADDALDRLLARKQQLREALEAIGLARHITDAWKIADEALAAGRQENIRSEP